MPIPETIPDYVHQYFAENPGPIRPPMLCLDGLQLSVQASFMHMSTPKADNGPYTHVEVCVIPFDQGSGIVTGDPLKPEGYIPVDQVNRLIHVCGGLSEDGETYASL